MTNQQTVTEEQLPAIVLAVRHWNRALADWGAAESVTQLPCPYSLTATEPTAPPPGRSAGTARPDGLLARHRAEMARFGTAVTTAGGIDPALAAGLDPAAYPVTPGGVPQAWERARVYRELCAHYRKLYWAQVAELDWLLEPAMAAAEAAR